MAAMVFLYERQTSTELADRADQLAFRQRLIKGIVDSSLDAVIAFTGDGKIRSWDGSAEKMFGWKREKAVGKNLFRLLTEGQKRSPTHDGMLRRLKETQAQRVFSERTEFEAVNKRGTPLQVEMSISPAIQIDDTTLYTAFVRDLTKVRRGRERVKRLRHDLNQVIEQTPDGMVLLHGTELVFANEAWRSWFGDDDAFDSDPFGIASLAVGDDRERFADYLARATSTATPMHLGEFRFVSADERSITLDIHFVPDVKFRGIESTLLVARDVTEQLAMREQLQISDRMATMGTLLAGVAHEINNPLTYVMGNLSVIEMALDESTNESTARARRALDDADEGAMRIVEIVRDMQRLCTVDDGTPVAVDPSVAIRSALKISENTTKYVAKVEVDLDEVPPVLASVSRIGQVILNLVVNAAQAFEDKDVEANIISVRAFAEHDQVHIEVEDNASGISPEGLEKIFDPFFTTKPTGEGTGLGLWISQRIIESLGGTLDVHSQEGLGTRFRISLGAAQSATDSGPVLWARGSRNHKLEGTRREDAIPALRLALNEERAPSPEFGDFEPTPTPPPEAGN
jgi:PAS domain S-box-containing protein